MTDKLQYEKDLILRAVCILSNGNPDIGVKFDDVVSMIKTRDHEWIFTEAKRIADEVMEKKK